MTKRQSGQAPGQYLGFAIQANRLVYHLLRARRNEQVSLELLGDVAKQGADGRTMVEEVKSRTSIANPVSDRARDLWKTFRNWLKAVETGDVVLDETRFFLHITGDFTGQIVEEFSGATNANDAHEAIEAAEAKLREGDEPSETIKKLIDYVFDGSRREVLAGIVTRFGLETGTATSTEEMIEALEEKAVPADISFKVLEQLVGWAKLKVEDLISSRRPAAISQSELMTELMATMRRVDRDTYIASFAPMPTAEEIENERGRPLVQQLELVELGEEETLSALADFLRATADRIDWSARGLIHGDSFDEIEDDLKVAWRNYKRRISVKAKELSDVERGQLLYSDCELHTAKLQGQSPPEHFTRGSYQALSDAMEVGWHPNYRKILGGKS